MSAIKVTNLLVLLLSVLALATCTPDVGGRTYYFVSPDGSDSNPGTQALPWRTLAKAAAAATKNCTVYLRAGTYEEQLKPANSGTTDEPIVFMSFPGETAILDGTGIDFPTGSSNDRWFTGLVHVDGLSNIEVSGLSIRNSNGSGILVNQSDAISVRDNRTYNTYSPGIAVASSSGVVVSGNTVEFSCVGHDQEGISVALTDDFEVSRNVVFDGLTEGIDAKVGSSNGRIVGNTVFRQGSQGIYIDAWDGHEHDIEVSGNTCHDNPNGITVSSEHGGLTESITVKGNFAENNDTVGIWVAGWGTTGSRLANIGVYGNVCSGNGEAGVFVHAVLGNEIDGVRVCNNILVGNGIWGIRVSGDSVVRNVSAINNTIVANGTLPYGGGGIYLDNLAQADSIVIRNNVASANGVFPILLEAGVPAAAVAIDHNLLWGSQTDGTQGISAVIADPSFVDAKHHDFHLTPGSPAVDMGSAASAPPDDYDENPRPQGIAHDIGAFELAQ